MPRKSCSVRSAAPGWITHERSSTRNLFKSIVSNTVVCLRLLPAVKKKKKKATQNQLLFHIRCRHRLQMLVNMQLCEQLTPHLQPVTRVLVLNVIPRSQSLVIQLLVLSGRQLIGRTALTHPSSYLCVSALYTLGCELCVGGGFSINMHVSIKTAAQKRWYAWGRSLLLLLWCCIYHLLTAVIITTVKKTHTHKSF